MRRVIVTEFMSLDGVVQAPGASEEDTTGGFEHGGWHLGYFDEVSREWVVENIAEADGFLFGRRSSIGRTRRCSGATSPRSTSFG